MLYWTSAKDVDARKQTNKDIWYLLSWHNFPLNINNKIWVSIVSCRERFSMKICITLINCFNIKLFCGWQNWVSSWNMKSDWEGQKLFYSYTSHKSLPKRKPKLMSKTYLMIKMITSKEYANFTDSLITRWHVFTIFCWNEKHSNFILNLCNLDFVMENYLLFKVKF